MTTTSIFLMFLGYGWLCHICVFVPNGQMEVWVHRQVKAIIFFISLTIAIWLVFILEKESRSLAYVPKNNIRQPITFKGKRHQKL